jgi:hypothetical protein
VLSSGTTVRWIGKREFDAKLLAAAPRILAENRSMATEMLNAVKAEIEPGTPLGPGHFGGIHLRDSYRVEVTSRGIGTIGRLMVPPQGYWREFGTKGGRKGAKARFLKGVSFAGTGGGERAGLFATHALAGVRRMISFYYGKGQWWRL